MSVTVMILASVVGFQLFGSDTGEWPTYVSQEGQFVVDFPTAPTSSATQTEDGPGGRLRIVTVSCETPSADYVAEKITLSTAVIQGAEEVQLNAFRDYIAQKYKGTVISEKRVRFEGIRPGLDFTIRAQSKPGVVGILRVREYLAGPSMYILIAGSVPNRELPDDIGKFFGSFSIGTTKIQKKVPQADVPGKELAGWGLAIDPDGDCQITVEGQALSMTIPGTLHDLNAEIDKYNAPRVLRDVEGDFEIQVKVVGDYKPAGPSTRKKALPSMGAGLVVWRDADNFIRLERAAALNRGKSNTYVNFEEREGGSGGAVHNAALAPGTAYLKLARRGSRIFGFTSKDGTHWTQLKPIDTVWPSELKVGLDAVTSSSEPFAVRFEELTFKAGRAGGAAPKPARSRSTTREALPGRAPGEPSSGPLVATTK